MRDVDVCSSAGRFLNPAGLKSVYRDGMRRSAVVGVALAGGMACSYVFELPSSSTPDAADASDPHSIADGSPSFDAPPVIPFCESQPDSSLYCNDFDDEPAPDLASDAAVVSVDGGTIVLSSAVSHSPPRSLLASVRDTNATATVTYALTTAPDGLTLSFDLLVSAWEAPTAEFSHIVLGERESDACFVRLEGHTSTWALTQVCSKDGVETERSTLDTTSSIVTGRWQRVALGITFAPNVTVTLDVDGSRVGEAPGAASLEPALASIAIGIGLAPEGGVTIFQDNILVTSP